ncbi:MAG TPA: phosphoglucosamine mutase, partial [Saprospiraceae bacterium]|nr:phosphoglucosamine mutase [Saprospiraceae bacterium]
TPTVEMAVTFEQADGGIIITASHNPKQWNALKLLNEKGEFLNASEGQEILRIAEADNFDFSPIDEIGVFVKKRSFIQQHIEAVLQLDLVDIKSIQKAHYKIVVDGVHSSGGVAIPALLRELGVEVVELFCEPTGDFPHNPEPLKENLTAISERVVAEKADLGIVVDPDVDRLAFINEDGSMFGEEYTLVACADYVLRKTPGNTVSNLSSSRALRDITIKHGGHYYASAVGEVNVVQKMKEKEAVIGGEGNGGIIYPKSHYGRDSLVGVALFLSHLAQSKKSCKALRASYPAYFMSKNKIALTPTIHVDDILEKMAVRYSDEEVSRIDGVKIDFKTEWVHLRKSNTEPIIRIYTERDSQDHADKLANKILDEIKEYI